VELRAINDGVFGFVRWNEFDDRFAAISSDGVTQARILARLLWIAHAAKAEF
jgi:hypothetical protein